MMKVLFSPFCAWQYIIWDAATVPLETTSSTVQSETLSLHDNSASLENDEDTDAQEVSSAEEDKSRRNISKTITPKSTKSKASRRSSIPSEENLARPSTSGKVSSPFNAGRLSSIGTSGIQQQRVAPGLAPSPSDDVAPFEDQGDYDNQDFVDDIEWSSTPAASLHGSDRKQKQTYSKSGSSSKRRPTPKSRDRVTPSTASTTSSSRHKKLSPNDEYSHTGKKTTNKRRVSYAPDVSVVSTPGSSEFPRGRALPDDSYHDDTGASLPPCPHTSRIASL